MSLKYTLRLLLSLYYINFTSIKKNLRLQKKEMRLERKTEAITSYLGDEVASFRHPNSEDTWYVFPKEMK